MRFNGHIGNSLVAPYHLNCGVEIFSRSIACTVEYDDAIICDCRRVSALSRRAASSPEFSISPIVAWDARRVTGRLSCRTVDDQNAVEARASGSAHRRPRSLGRGGEAKAGSSKNPGGGAGGRGQEEGGAMDRW